MGAKHTPSAQYRKRQRRYQRLLPQIHTLYDDLIERFPHTFFRNPMEVQPLKKGIYADLRALLPASSKVLQGALHLYTRQPAYQQALAAGLARLDLTGHAVDTVTQAERRQAVASLTSRRQPPTTRRRGGHVVVQRGDVRHG